MTGYEKRERSLQARIRRADASYDKYLKEFGMTLGEHGKIVNLPREGKKLSALRGR